MKDIKQKAQQNELNLEKGEDLGRSPRKFIPVPKVKNEKEKGSQYENKRNNKI